MAKPWWLVAEDSIVQSARASRWPSDDCDHEAHFYFRKYFACNPRILCFRTPGHFCSLDFYCILLSHVSVTVLGVAAFFVILRSLSLASKHHLRFDPLSGSSACTLIRLPTPSSAIARFVNTKQEGAGLLRFFIPL